eukprot:8662745-Alexandrium_andersonii.AAC.1
MVVPACRVDLPCHLASGLPAGGTETSFDRIVAIATAGPSSHSDGQCEGQRTNCVDKGPQGLVD